MNAKEFLSQYQTSGKDWMVDKGDIIIKLLNEYTKELWTDEDMKAFARIASEGSYGEYKGCKTIVLKLKRYEELKKFPKEVTVTDCTNIYKNQ